MQDGSFLRLISVEVGYSFPHKWIKKAFLSKLRIYYSGTNLLTFSKFDLWDPEMAGNGLGYPIQRVHNIGIQVGFYIIDSYEKKKLYSNFNVGGSFF